MLNSEGERTPLDCVGFASLDVVCRLPVRV